jgi:hypothetical protein
VLAGNHFIVAGHHDYREELESDLTPREESRHIDSAKLIPGGVEMRKKTYKPEEIISKLREVDVLIAS